MTAQLRVARSFLVSVLACWALVGSVFAQIPDKMLVRPSGGVVVFLVWDNELHHVPNACTFSRMGYRWTDVLEVDVATLQEQFPEGRSYHPAEFWRRFGNPLRNALADVAACAEDGMPDGSQSLPLDALLARGLGLGD